MKEGIELGFMQHDTMVGLFGPYQLQHDSIGEISNASCIFIQNQTVKLHVHALILTVNVWCSH
jgi:hypothetical protein